LENPIPVIRQEATRVSVLDSTDAVGRSLEVLRKLAPLIKHDGFREEREYRLVFSPRPDEEPQVVFFDDLASESVKKPRVHVGFGNGRWQPDTCEYIAVPESWRDLNLRARLGDVGSSRTMLFYYPNDEGPDAYVGPGRREQATIARLRAIAKVDRPGAAVWADSKWPIRSITVGPRPNQPEVAEALQRYCRNHWWLADITVGCSSTPYRPPRR
jgi:hypothetical protein